MKLLRPRYALAVQGTHQVVGIDLAFSGPTGVATLHFEDFLLAHEITGLGVIRPKKRRRKDASSWGHFIDTLADITTGVQEYLIRSSLDVSTLIAIEIPGGRRKGFSESSNMLRLGLAVGALTQHLRSYGYPIILIDTNTIRYYLCGRIAVSKQATKARIEELYGEIIDVPENDNVCDAIATAHTGFLLQQTRIDIAQQKRRNKHE